MLRHCPHVRCLAFLAIGAGVAAGPILAQDCTVGINSIPSAVVRGDPIEVTWAFNCTVAAPHANLHYRVDGGAERPGPLHSVGAGVHSFTDAIPTDAFTPGQTITIRAHVLNANAESFYSSAFDVAIEAPELRIRLLSVPAAVPAGENVPITYEVQSGEPTVHVNVHYRRQGTTRWFPGPLHADPAGVHEYTDFIPTAGLQAGDLLEFLMHALTRSAEVLTNAHIVALEARACTTAIDSAPASIPAGESLTVDYHVDSNVGGDHFNLHFRPSDELYEHPGPVHSFGVGRTDATDVVPTLLRHLGLDMILRSHARGRDVECFSPEVVVPISAPTEGPCIAFIQTLPDHQDPAGPVAVTWGGSTDITAAAAHGGLMIRRAFDHEYYFIPTCTEVFYPAGTFTCTLQPDDINLDGVWETWPLGPLLFRAWMRVFDPAGGETLALCYSDEAAMLIETESGGLCVAEMIEIPLTVYEGQPIIGTFLAAGVPRVLHTNLHYKKPAWATERPARVFTGMGLYADGILDPDFGAGDTMRVRVHTQTAAPANCYTRYYDVAIVAPPPSRFGLWAGPQIQSTPRAPARPLRLSFCYQIGNPDSVVNPTVQAWAPPANIEGAPSKHELTFPGSAPIVDDVFTFNAIQGGNELTLAGAFYGDTWAAGQYTVNTFQDVEFSGYWYALATGGICGGQAAAAQAPGDSAADSGGTDSEAKTEAEITCGVRIVTARLEDGLVVATVEVIAPARLRSSVVLEAQEAAGRAYRSSAARGAGSYRVPLQARANGPKLQVQAQATIGGRAYASRLVELTPD